MRRALSKIPVLLCVLTTWANPQPTEQLEYRVKAAILYNIAKFVEWPESDSSAAIEFCILGQDPFGRILDEAASGKKISDRTIVVRRVQRATEATGCSLLFISSSETRRVQEILGTLGASPTLTVSEIPRFAEQGGMVNFIPLDGAVRFEVNVSAAQHAGLRISSQLLRLARIVGRRNGSQE